MLHCQPMRYIVYGSGAIGSAIGGMLAQSYQSVSKAQHDSSTSAIVTPTDRVVLLARPQHAQAINEQGLIISTATGELRIPVRAVTSLKELTATADDCILLTVKTQNSYAAINELADWSGNREMPIVCLQNGIRNEEIARSRFHNVIGALVHFNVNFLAPGRIERPLWNTIALGRFPEAPPDPLVEMIAADLRNAGFDVHLHSRIMRPKWGKLIANLNNATNAITDTYLQRALADPEHREFMADVMAEGIEVLDRAGIPLDDGGIFDARAMVAALRLPPKEDHTWAMPESDRSYPSTWQDLMLGRGYTEARFLNGEITNLAKKLNLPAPIYNSVLLGVIEVMAQSREKPGRYNLAGLKELIKNYQNHDGWEQAPG